MRIEVDLSRCQGYGNCVLAAPDLFDLDDASGTALVLVERPGAGREDAAREAARACPVQAIALSEE